MTGDSGTDDLTTRLGDLGELIGKNHGAGLRRYGQYPNYKSSGLDWLGAIPADWKTKKIKFVAPIRLAKLDLRPDDALYVGLEHVESWTGRLLLDNQPETVDSVVASFRAGDVLFGKLRPYLAKAARPDFNGVCTSELVPLRPTSESVQGYLMYCLLDAPFIFWLDSLTYGTKMPRLSPDQIGSSFVPVPSVPEQRAIAAFLDRETARIDALVAKKERVIELLQEKRTALITRAVTQGLDPNAPMRDSGAEWLGEIPAHWESRELRRLTRKGTSITYGIVQAGPDVEGGVPYIRTSDMSGDLLPRSGYQRTSSEIDSIYMRSKVAIGDIVVAIRATVGKALPVPEYLAGANLTQGTAKVAPGEMLRSRFLLAALQSGTAQQRFAALAKGATFREITLDMLRRFLIAVPSVVEQEEIVEFLDRETAKIDTLVAKVRNAIDRLKELRTALISAAVTGKIDVRGEVA